jgi:hypothetical protein
MRIDRVQSTLVLPELGETIEFSRIVQCIQVERWAENARYLHQLSIVTSSGKGFVRFPVVTTGEARLARKLLDALVHVTGATSVVLRVAPDGAVMDLSRADDASGIGGGIVGTLHSEVVRHPAQVNMGYRLYERPLRAEK